MAPSLKSTPSVLCALILAGCSSSGSSLEPIAAVDAAPAAPSEFAIVTVSGAPLSAFAGEAIPLKVVHADVDGATHDLPSGAVVTWTTPGGAAALPPGSEDPDPFPLPGTEATSTWVSNPSRSDIDLTNVLVVFDPGLVQNASISVNATISGAGLTATAQANIQVPSPHPRVDWNRGATSYGANCAMCHGPTTATRRLARRPGRGLVRSQREDLLLSCPRHQRGTG